MKKQILAASIAAVFVAAFMVPSLSTSFAQTVSSESRVEQAILALTEVIKGQTDDLNDSLSNIHDDLFFKKKFWQHRFPVTNQHWDIGVWATCPGFPGDPSACAFNVESIQLKGANPSGGTVIAIWVDGVRTDLTSLGQNQTVPTNLLVDTGIGKLGANRFVFLECDMNDMCTAEVEYNGEKPQGMFIWRFLVTGTLDIVCVRPEFQPGGQSTECPEELIDDIRPLLPPT
jgi:hypothetical protein